MAEETWRIPEFAARFIIAPNTVAVPIHKGRIVFFMFCELILISVLILIERCYLLALSQRPSILAQWQVSVLIWVSAAAIALLVVYQFWLLFRRRKPLYLFAPQGLAVATTSYEMLIPWQFVQEVHELKFDRHRSSAGGDYVALKISESDFVLLKPSKLAEMLFYSNRKFAGYPCMTLNSEMTVLNQIQLYLLTKSYAEKYSGLSDEYAG